MEVNNPRNHQNNDTHAAENDEIDGGLYSHGSHVSPAYSHGSHDKIWKNEDEKSKIMDKETMGIKMARELKHKFAKMRRFNNK